LTAEEIDCVGTTTAPERVGDIQAAGIRPVVLELAQTDRVHALLLDRGVVFLAVAAGRAHRDYRQVYLEGARHLINASKNTPVRRLIYTSSTGVYGQDDGSWVDEDSPTQPVSERGRILVETEQCLLNGAARLGICATVVRLSGIYGPGRGPQNRLAQVAGGQRDDGDAYVNLIHLDDIVTAMRKLIEVEYHGVLNLTDDAPTTRRDYYDCLIAEAGLPPIQWISGDHTGRGKRVRNDRIKRLLNLSLQHPEH
jgi:nucleoside-diphosphate-sugar epimerase